MKQYHIRFANRELFPTTLPEGTITVRNDGTIVYVDDESEVSEAIVKRLVDLKKAVADLEAYREKELAEFKRTGRREIAIGYPEESTSKLVIRDHDHENKLQQ